MTAVKVIIRCKTCNFRQSYTFMGKPKPFHLYNLMQDDEHCPSPLDLDMDELKEDYDNVRVNQIIVPVFDTYLKSHYVKEALEKEPDEVIDHVAYREYVWNNIPEEKCREMITTYGGTSLGTSYTLLES